MGSEFDAFMDESFQASREVFGEEQFHISGKSFTKPLTVKGSWNELGTTSELELAGETIIFSAVLQIAVSEFGKRAPVAGMEVTRVKDGRTFRIVGEVNRDSLTFTFPLQTVHK